MNVKDPPTEMDRLKAQSAALEQLLGVYEQTVIEQASRLQAHAAKIRDQSDILRAIAVGTATTTGEEFFRSLVSHLTLALRVKYAFVGKLTGDGEDCIRTLAGSAGNEISDNFEYELRGTPCENVVAKGPCFYPENVRRLFSNDHLLEELGVECYCGTPLLNRSGKTLGILVIMHNQPMHSAIELFQTLNLFAARAAAEIERLQVEETLRRQQIEQQTLFDLIPAMVWYKDTQNRILRANRLAAQSIHKRVEEVEGRSTYDLYPEQAEQYYQDDLEVCASGKPKLGIVELYPTASGAKRWIQTDKVPYRDAQGKVLGILVLAQDITERKQAEEIRERLASIVESSDDAIISRSLDGTILSWNLGAEVMFGYAAEEIVGRPFTVLIPSDRLDEAPSLIERLKVGRPISHFETVRRRKDGQEIVVSINLSPIQDATGEVIGASHIFRDITQRKRGEEALRESRERFSNAFQDAAIGMALVGTNGRWLQVNHALCESVGYSEQELLATSFQAITHPDDLDADLAYVRQMLAGEISTYHMEKRYFHKRGHVVWILLNVSLVRDTQQRPWYFIAQIQDITERKEMTEALRERESQLRQALEERERLSQDLHDNIIQTIFAVGLGLEECQRLIQENHPTVIKKLGQAISELNLVIEDVRYYIVGVAPRIRFSAKYFRAELKRLVHMIHGTKASPIHLEVDPQAVNALAPSAGRHVLFITREAISNSLRHSEARNLTVALQPENGSVRLTVEDDGTGFDTHSASHGHGLRNIAARTEKLGGRLQIISQPGHGTRVLVDIPKGALHVAAQG